MGFKQGMHPNSRNGFKKGKLNPNYEKYSEKNPNWNGNNISYAALHQWVSRHKSKPKFCEECNKNKPYDLANISGKYKRDIEDYRWLCRSCHMKDDGRLDKLMKNARIANTGKSLSDETKKKISDRVQYRKRDSKGVFI